jgi:glucose 1-dehydrogenase
MKAIAILPGTKELRLVDRPVPSVSGPDVVTMSVVRVGICGTDREEVAGGRAQAPEGSKDLVIGHEMLGRVEEVGKEVTRVRPGDFAVFTVRRGCGRCVPCNMDRPDMCMTGDYLERGIKGLDGYQSERVADSERYVVKVPEELATAGVLCEPLSVAEKAIDESLRIQSARMPEASACPDWLFGRRCLVTGLGPIGLLAALALRLRGAEVHGLDIVDPGTARPAWLEGIGGAYTDGREVTPDKLEEKIGRMDMIFESTGVPGLAFNLLDALSVNGVYVLTGIPGGDRPVQVRGADMMRQMVLNNQVMVGSVNASRDHFRMAVKDLETAELKWPGHAAGLITNRHPYKDYKRLQDPHPPEEIKSVIEWAS